MSLAKQFIDAYSTIEKYLSKLNKSGKHMSFSNSVNTFAKKNNVIATYRDDLIEYGQLRNAIVHDRVLGTEIIAEPHEAVVKHIQHIASLLTKPKTLKDFPFAPLLTCQLDDLFADVLNEMAQKGYSQVPVCEGDIVKNVLSSSMIVHYMYENIEQNMIDLNKVLIKDVIEHNQKHYQMVHIKQSLWETIELFGDKASAGQPLSALVVIDDQSKHKGPVGVLTPKDIVMLLKLLNEY